MTEMIASHTHRNLKGHIEDLQVRELHTGKCVVVLWNEFHHQYQTARACEILEGGLRCGRRPGDVGRHLSRAYALREFRRIRAEIQERAEGLQAWAARDIDQEVRSALIDNARLFGIQHRRDGVTLSAEIDGITYLVNTGSGCAEIEEIEQALAGYCTTSLMDPGDWRFIVTL